MSRRAVAFWSAILLGWAAVSPAAPAGPRLEAHALADGRTAVLLDSQLYLPDAAGSLRRAADGEYPRRDGGVLVVAAGRAESSGGRRYDLPAPRLALASTLASGEAVALLDGELLFVEADGARRPVPDGTYHFRNGGAAQVRGGRITSLGDLTGFRQFDPDARPSGATRGHGRRAASPLFASRSPGP